MLYYRRMKEYESRILASQLRSNAEEQRVNRNQSRTLAIASALPVIPALIELTNSFDPRAIGVAGLFSLISILFGANAIRAGKNRKLNLSQVEAIQNPILA